MIIVQSDHGMLVSPEIGIIQKNIGSFHGKTIIINNG